MTATTAKENCEKIGAITICELHEKWRNYNETCLGAIFNQIEDVMTQLCRIVIQPRTLHVQRLTPDTIYVDSPTPEKVEILCDNEEKDLLIEGTMVVYLGKDCQLRSRFGSVSRVDKQVDTSLHLTSFNESINWAIVPETTLTKKIELFNNSLSFEKLQFHQSKLHIGWLQVIATTVSTSLFLIFFILLCCLFWCR